MRYEGPIYRPFGEAGALLNPSHRGLPPQPPQLLHGLQIRTLLPGAPAEEIEEGLHRAWQDRGIGDAR